MLIKTIAVARLEHPFKSYNGLFVLGVSPLWAFSTFESPSPIIFFIFFETALPLFCFFVRSDVICADFVRSASFCFRKLVLFIQKTHHIRTFLTREQQSRTPTIIAQI